VALAEELLALLIVLVTSLSGTRVLAIEMSVSLSPKRTSPAIRIVRITRIASLFTALGNNELDPQSKAWHQSGNLFVGC